MMNQMKMVNDLAVNQKLAFIHSNSSNQLQSCLHHFEYYYNEGQITLAIEQLWLGISLFEFNEDMALKEQLLKASVSAIVFFVHVPEFNELLENTIAHESTNDCPEILSMCFFCLSYTALHNQQVDMALTHAKTAYFYSQKIQQQEKKKFYECNAQLQLVCVLAEGGRTEEVESYIERFNWYLKNCKNDSDKLLVLAISATLELLKSNEVASNHLMKTLLTQFSDLREVMYTSYIALHFKRMLHLFASVSSEKQQLLLLCDRVVKRFSSKSNGFLEAMPKNYYVQSEAFFRQALIIFEQNKQVHKETCLVKFKVANTEDSNLEALLALFDYRTFPYALHLFEDKQFVFITSEDGRKIFSNFMMKEPHVHYIAEISSNHEGSFFDLYNQLNLKIIKQSITFDEG